MIPSKTIEESCLLAGVAVPLILLLTQIIAAPFFPGYSFTQESVSILGTHFSRHPEIFNCGAMLTGISALAGSLGLFLSFFRKVPLLISVVISLAVACLGVMSIKAAIFPLPDPRHNSWDVLQNFILVIPHLLLLGLWKQRRSRGLQIFLLFCVALLFLLTPFSAHLGRGTLQRLINAATLIPLGVVSFNLWRELRSDETHRIVRRGP